MKLKKLVKLVKRNGKVDLNTKQKKPFWVIHNEDGDIEFFCNGGSAFKLKEIHYQEFQDWVDWYERTPGDKVIMTNNVGGRDYTTWWNSYWYGIHKNLLVDPTIKDEYGITKKEVKIILRKELKNYFTKELERFFNK